jgi:alpha,alpha-trehalose phosphorylase
MRDHGGQLTFAPRLPAAVTRLAFRIGWGECRLLVEVDHQWVTYSLLQGESLDFEHDGEAVTVEAAEPLTRPTIHPPPREPPRQPPGREPERRRNPRRA